MVTLYNNAPRDRACPLGRSAIWMALLAATFSSSHPCSGMGTENQTLGAVRPIGRQNDAERPGKRSDGDHRSEEIVALIALSDGPSLADLYDLV